MLKFLQTNNRFLKSIKTYRYLYLAILLLIAIFIFSAWRITLDAKQKYQEQLSITIYDRLDTPISVKENNKGHYVYELTSLPTDFEKLLLKKEDRFFYYHPGINPISSLRALKNYLLAGDAGGSSTITQQLAKNLLQNETDRNLSNKFAELFYAASLELFLSKKEILLMYANTVFLGNQIQGFETGSYAYFEKPLSETSLNEQISLLVTLSYPSSRNPWEKDNLEYARNLSEKITLDETFVDPIISNKYSFQSDSFFELRTAGVDCNKSCYTTIDDKLTKDIRSILSHHIDDGYYRDIKNGAVVVINPKNSEVLAMIGSRNPNSDKDGNKINMTIKPRPIGSTIKPFIYAKGFKAGLRPYSLVDDREYKYPIATGFSLYPKNYDGLYRGEVTLHTALSNSLNVPSVKVLEYVELENFYRFLSEDLEFTPIQDFDSYQYGIALGGLEMDLMTLTHYFTVFPKGGTIEPIKVLLDDSENFSLPPQSNIIEEKTVIEKEYIELVHTIISDRFTGVNQFGLESNLNLTTNEYGVKTGTSRDFHDSWVVGYTPDFVVGVWLGNNENKPLKQVSGQSGAGAVWHDVMEYLLSSEYNHKNTFKSENLVRFTIDNNEEWGLREDVIDEHRELLLTDNLILKPHPNDIFELTDNTVIPLVAKKVVSWSINNVPLGDAKTLEFSPRESGKYEVSAYDESNDKLERIFIKIVPKE